MTGYQLLVLIRKGPVDLHMSRLVLVRPVMFPLMKMELG